MKKIMLILSVIYLLINVTDVFANNNSKADIVVDINTGRILYENNSREKLLIASTTKIMTAIIVIENANLNEMVKVGQEILTMYGTNIYLDVGEEITVKDLLYGLIMRSGNDASVVLAKYVAGTEEEFVKLMNQKAKEIGMNDTTFSNPHGLDDNTKNYSTAYDMALLSLYASQNPTYNKISKTQKYSVNSNKKSYLWYNRNKLLQQYKYCTGGKNGYTPAAGKTLVSTATKNSTNLTIVSLNSSDPYYIHKTLYDKYFEKYRNYKIIKKGEKYKYNKKIYIADEEFSYPLTTEEKEKIHTEINIQNQKYISIMLNDEEIGRIKIKELKQKKEAETLLEKINYLLESLKKFILGRQNNLNPGPFVPKPLDI